MTDEQEETYGRCALCGIALRRPTTRYINDCGRCFVPGEDFPGTLMIPIPDFYDKDPRFGRNVGFL